MNDDHWTIVHCHLVNAVVDVARGPQPPTHINPMSNEQADQIEDRLIDFGARIIFLSGKLPASLAGDHITRQMLRSGTSPAPNYGEARGAESRADFVHKLGIALKELNETKVWLKMLQRARLATVETVHPVLDECQQLARLLNASIQTARRNKG
jgi:four helix bundle protein